MTLPLAEMYVPGVSTRKVKAITEQLCGVSVSSAHVSQAAAQMDEELTKWRERPLGEYPFLFLDAYYEQVREDRQVRDLTVLSAVGSILPGNEKFWAFPCHSASMKCTGRASWKASKGAAWAACD